jgi:6-phosphogluconolactonase (cycloisomerase 2 family)
MTKSMRHWTFSATILGISLLYLAQPHRAVAQNKFDGNSHIYVMTNEPAGNNILVFRRGTDGSLTKIQTVSTQGKGSYNGAVDPLGSQGALTLSSDGRFLVAVNAGSNEISNLAVTEDGLQFLSKAYSGGTMPVSVAIRADLAYVLNAGATPNVAVFRINLSGTLSTIAGATRSLPGGTSAGPAQVGITADGEVLVVTEKNTNQIDLFPVNDDGTLSSASTFPSNGSTPFGFTFSRDRTLIVSEAKASTFSSYHIESVENSPTLQTITKSVGDGGMGACWIVRDRHLVFAANSASNTISSLTVLTDRELQLFAPIAGATPSGTTPIDMASTRDGRFLYVIGSVNGSLTGFEVQDGSLNEVTSVSGLPVSIQGIAAR